MRFSVHKRGDLLLVVIASCLMMPALGRVGWASVCNPGCQDPPPPNACTAGGDGFTFLEVDGNVGSDGAANFDWANGGANAGPRNCGTLSGSQHCNGFGGIFDDSSGCAALGNRAPACCSTVPPSCGSFVSSTTPPIPPALTAAAINDKSILTPSFTADQLSGDNSMHCRFQVEKRCTTNTDCTSSTSGSTFCICGNKQGLACTSDAACTGCTTSGRCASDTCVPCAGDPTSYTGAGAEKNGDLLSADTYGKSGGGSLPNKDDISNVYALAHQVPLSADTSACTSCTTAGDGCNAINEVYVGYERVVNTGDSHVDLEFLQNQVNLIQDDPTNACAGHFRGNRAQGDFLIAAEFEKGGALPIRKLYRWVCDPSNPVGTPQGTVCNPTEGHCLQQPTILCTIDDDCSITKAGDTCNVRNNPQYQQIAGAGIAAVDQPGLCSDNPQQPCTQTDLSKCGPGAMCHLFITAVAQGVNQTDVGCGGWACRSSNGTQTATIASNQLYEVGVDLAGIGFNKCISTFLPHTRSTKQFTATLKDFTIIPFNTCMPSTKLTVTASSSTVPSGGSVTYTYTEENTGNVALTNPFIVDDKCAPVSSTLKPDGMHNVGDVDNDGVLDIGEVWTFTCTLKNITQSTTNTAIGHATFMMSGTTNDVTFCSDPSNPPSDTLCSNASACTLPITSSSCPDCDPAGPRTTCERAQTTVTVSDVTVKTDILNASGAVITSATVGDKIHDKVYVTKTTGTPAEVPNPTGKVTFHRYTTGDCNGTPTDEMTTLGTDGTAQSSEFTVAGAVSYKGEYLGDTNYPARTGACEPLRIVSIKTKLSATIVAAGQSVYDTATLSGVTSDAGGTVTYIACSDNQCTQNCRDAGTKTVTNGIVPNSDALKFDAGGVFYWLASYSGDAKNAATKGTCGDADETLKVADDTVTTDILNASGAVITSAIVGDKIHDTITVKKTDGTPAEVPNPTGKVTFHRYATADCTGTPVDEMTTLGTDGTAQSSEFTIVGAVSYKGEYLGDTNYPARVGACELLRIVSIKTKLSAAIVAAGQSVYDTTSLSGVTSDAGGTVSYIVCSDNQCTQNCRDAGTKTVTNGIVPNSDTLKFDTAGTYYWLASYSGDAKNAAVKGVCGDPDETLRVDAIKTKLSANVVAAGQSVYDTTTLSGVTSDAGGTVSYIVCSDNQCTQNCRDAGTKTVTNGIVPNSDTLKFDTAGTFYWLASYSGDAKNAAVKGVCGDPDETLRVDDIKTKLSATIVPAGQSVYDTATLSGVTGDAGGTVSYIACTDNQCTQNCRDAGTKTVTNGVVPNSDTLKFDTAGTFYWLASYSGDAKNAAVKGVCGDPDETLRVDDIKTKLSATMVVAGQSVYDTATLSGVTTDAGGTVTYTVYSDDQCTQKAQSAGTKVVTNGVVPNSDPVKFTTGGTFYWQASYSGDTKNAAVKSVCKDEILVVIGPCVLGYPTGKAPALSSVPFNESEVLRTFGTVSSSGQVTGGAGVVTATLNDRIAAWYNDEHALTLGVKQVNVKTTSGTTSTPYTLPTPIANPDHLSQPSVGTTQLGTGNFFPLTGAPTPTGYPNPQAGTDLATWNSTYKFRDSGRPLWPAVFITDITNGASNAGDWQQGGTAAIPPSDVFGTWKAAVRTVDQTSSPWAITVAPQGDPPKNDPLGNARLGGGDVPPLGFGATYATSGGNKTFNEGYSAEIRWNVSDLTVNDQALQTGHIYRLQFMVHDGDQNKSGGDVGEACLNVIIPSD